MLNSIWNLRKKLPNSTRKTLRTLANEVKLGSFLPPPDEERLIREQQKEATELGLLDEVKNVEDFADTLHKSQEAMRNLGQDEDTIQKLTQKDFNQWKIQMEKQGKHWESALKLFLKYRGKLLWVLGLKNAYEATKYDPLAHFNPTYMRPGWRRYVNKLENNYKSSIIIPPYGNAPPNYNYQFPLVKQPPLYIQQPPIYSPSFPQLGRGRYRSLTKRRKSRKIKRKH